MQPACAGCAVEARPFLQPQANACVACGDWRAGAMQQAVRCAVNAALTRIGSWKAGSSLACLPACLQATSAACAPTLLASTMPRPAPCLSSGLPLVHWRRAATPSAGCEQVAGVERLGLTRAGQAHLMSRNGVHGRPKCPCMASSAWFFSTFRARSFANPVF